MVTTGIGCLQAGLMPLGRDLTCLLLGGYPRGRSTRAAHGVYTRDYPAGSNSNFPVP